MDAHPDQFKHDIEENEFVGITRSIEEFIGDTVMIRFQLIANFFRNEDGWYIDDLTVDGSPVSVEDQKLTDNMVIDVFPNPVQNITNLNVKITYPSNLIIGVYNELGNKVVELNSDYFNAGNHNIPLEMGQLASGIYYIRISSDKDSQTVPVVINR